MAIVIKKKIRRIQQPTEPVATYNTIAEDPPPVETEADNKQHVISPERAYEVLNKLSKEYTVKVSHFSSLTMTRKLSDRDNAKVGELFGAKGSNISATKKVWDTKDYRLKEVLDAKNDLLRFVRESTYGYPLMDGVKIVRIPTPKDEEIFAKSQEMRPDHPDLSPEELREEAVKTIREGRYKEFLERFHLLSDRLDRSVAHFNEHHFLAVVDSRREALGEKFNRHDYGEKLTEEGSIDFVDIVPSQYHTVQNAVVHQMVASRMRENIIKATDQIVDNLLFELQNKLANLAERMTGDNGDGKPKVFRNSSIETIKEAINFFTNELTEIGLTNEKLNEAMRMVNNLVEGIGDPDRLRGTHNTAKDAREAVRRQTEEVFLALNEQLVDRPKRNVKRTIDDLIKRKERVEE